MAGKLEYDFAVRRLIPASVAAFGLFALFLPAASQAQIHGVPTSVTSTGFGGHFDRVPGTRPSVTSLGPLGYTAGDHAFNPNPQHCCTNPFAPVGAFSSPNPPQNGSHHPHHHPSGGFGGYYAVPYPVYLAEPIDSGVEEQAPPADEADYAPGPTIFDRRGSLEPSSAAEAAYAQRRRETRREEQEVDPEAAAPQPEPPVERPQTILVFKDGHQLEVQNYAIVGNLLYDMTPGRPNKIAVADLDLAATTKVNDNRGIDFQLPVRPATN